MTSPLASIQGWENLEIMEEARNYNAFLVKQVSSVMKGRRRILDFGAGRGTFALRMREHGHDVQCIEPEAALRSALQKAGFAAQASFDATPPRSLDGIYMLNVLEHIGDDEAILKESYDRLVDGGRLYVYVPAFQILYSGMDRLVGHVRRYRRSDLVEKCRRAGFIVEKARYCDSLGFWATLAYKAIESGNGEINRRGLILYDRLLFPLSCAIDLIGGGSIGKNLWVVASRVVDLNK